MPKFDTLETVSFKASEAKLSHCQLPELVHLDDPATMAMIDFQKTPTAILPADLSIEHALNEMQVLDVHALLIAADDGLLQGIISSSEILGEKPIQIIQQKRISREKILVKMVMTKIADIPAFSFETIEYARVGNVVNTLNSLNKPYALVIDTHDKNNKIRGLFILRQIAHQLHKPITQGMQKNTTVLDLKKNHFDE